MPRIHFDLNSAVDMVGTIDMVKIFLARFREEMNNKLSEIENATKKGDIQTIRRSCHALKGSAGYVCAFPLQQVCLELQNLCDSPSASISDIESLVQKLSATIQEAHKEINTIIK